MRSRPSTSSGTDPTGGGTTTYTYDAGNRLASLTDPDNNTKTYQYDSANRVTTVTNPLGQTTYTYDLMDNETGMTDNDGRIFQDRIRWRQPRDRQRSGSPSAAGQRNTITYTYDSAGRLTRPCKRRHKQARVHIRQRQPAID